MAKSIKKMNEHTPLLKKVARRLVRKLRQCGHDGRIAVSAAGSIYVRVFVDNRGWQDSLVVRISSHESQQEKRIPDLDIFYSPDIDTTSFKQYCLEVIMNLIDDYRLNKGGNNAL